MAEPLVSVIMCVYNAGSYLRPAIESVLRQTYRNLEFLIVDDGSTDGCMEEVGDLLSDARVRVIRQANSGKPAAMNVALEQMRGEFYALNDADDLSHPQRIERQVRCLLENPDVAGVFCGHEIILDGRRMAPHSIEKNREASRRDIEDFRMPGHDPTAMYRFSAVGHVRYETELPIVEGFDYVLRVGEQQSLLVLGECLYSYRIHSQSVTKRDPAKRDRLVREVLKRACARRGIDFKSRFPMEPGADCPEAFVDNNLAAQFIESVLDQRRAGRRLGAIGTGVACSRLHPMSPHYHKALVYATAPMWVVKRLRRNSD
jgi:glycosyltransferase involved in cell wall biosynthesis